jgi:DNA-binding response OmpR family regulator
LELEGATVFWWRPGGDALIGVPAVSPDAVICDIGLPDRSGEEVFRELTSFDRVMPFVFVTGHGDTDQAARLMRKGARDYLLKPFPMNDFLNRLEQVFEPVDVGA